MFSVAFASDVVSSNSSSLLSLTPLIFLFVVFYFFIIRPSKKRSQQEEKMRSTLRVGDKIVTNSGIFGTIMQIDDAKSVVSIEISKGVNLTLYKSSIAETLTKKENEKTSKK
jgi:preprotein translocase subunit YajC